MRSCASSWTWIGWSYPRPEFPFFPCLSDNNTALRAEKQVGIAPRKGRTCLVIESPNSNQ
jgi:hypothetical protein